MKKLILVAALAAAGYFSLGPNSALHRAPDTTAPVRADQNDALQTALREQKSGIQVTGQGTITKLLADDNDGSRHQRFLLALPSGQTLLVAHNIDLAPRLASIRSGDTIEFKGVYEWNAKGGVIHWTHRDPSGRHQAGWLKHAGQTYQ